MVTDEYYAVLKRSLALFDRILRTHPLNIASFQMVTDESVEHILTIALLYLPTHPLRPSPACSQPHFPSGRPCRSVGGAGSTTFLRQSGLRWRPISPWPPVVPPSASPLLGASSALFTLAGFISGAAILALLGNDPRESRLIWFRELMRDLRDILPSVATN